MACLNRISKFLEDAIGYDKYSERACDTFGHQIVEAASRRMKKQGLPGFDRAEGAHIYEKIKTHTDQDPVTQQFRERRMR